MPASPSSTRKKGAAKSFILLGGFLGAGKTTCLVALARWLRKKELRCGIITNDQGEGLVDTASVMETKEAVRQITGGCFCCRANELMEAVRELEKSARPDVFIAEPVGSCTDLVATVLLPLEQVYKTGFRRAPMSVVLDGKRAWGNYFGKARAGEGFSKDVRYIYLKQMEEAEVLVVNKTDLLPVRERKRLMERLGQDFPGKRVLAVSARTGEGMEEWFGLLMGEESKPERVMEVDYKRYGKGEALMGWLNGELEIRMTNDECKMTNAEGMDGNALLLKLARGIQRELEKAGVEIAHFKMSLNNKEPTKGRQASRSIKNEPTRKAGKGLAVVNAVRNGDAAELSRRLSGPVTAGELLVNLRAEAAPELLEKIVTAQVAKLAKKVPLRWMEMAAFRPGMPVPVHRAVSVGAKS